MGEVVVRLTAGEAESALRTAGVWGVSGHADVSGTTHERGWVVGALARAAVVMALGGYKPPWVIVRGSDRPNGQIVVHDKDAARVAVVRVEVAIAEPLEETTLTVVGWMWARDRKQGARRGRSHGWKVPAYVIPRSAQRDIAELRELAERSAPAAHTAHA